MTENEAFVMDVMEEGSLEMNGRGDVGNAPDERVPISQEMARYEEVLGVVETGNGLKVDGLLNEWEKQGWLRDWRNEENLTLYSVAITDGFLDVINALLKYDIPLGDTLIRAIDSEFDDAVKAICRYLHTNEDLLDDVINGHCDNDDFHPALTPLILAAQRNNFNTVQLLVELGAKIEEPSISLGGDVTLTQAISTLHIYRAISQPAFILATQTDIFGYVFAISAKLRSLSRSWTDFGAELIEMAERVQLFAGEMLGQSASTTEILALFRYHNTDKYRDTEGKQHPLAKMFEAIKYSQKEFIAHPHSQKAIISQFYRNILDWNEKGFWYQMLLMFMVLLGYPIISLLYIFVPVRKVVYFTRQPYIMFLMNAGSGFTFLAFNIAVTVINKNRYPRTADALHALLFIWVIGLMWLHMKRIMKHGTREYLSQSVNLHEAVVIALYIAVFFLQWNGMIHISPNAPLRRTVRDGTYLDNDSFSDLQSHMVLVLGGLQGNFSDTLVEGVNEILVKALSTCCREDDMSSFSVEAAPPLPPALQATTEYSQFEPIVVANTLLGMTIVFSTLRLMNLVLVSESVGPLRISLGGMVADILKFCCIFLVIWLAFAIGMFQNYFSAGQSATRECIEGGEDADDCTFLTGFSTFATATQDLYWSLYGLVELDVLMLPAKYSVAEAMGTFMYFTYHIVAVLVLLNALIGMLSNTYNLTEERADTEWKFHRTVVWAEYMRPVGTLPPPFNMIPSVKSLFRFCRYIIGIWLSCVRRKVANRKVMHSKRELADYVRVLKLTRDRYIQVNLSTASTNAEEVRPRDLQSLRNDFMALRFFAEDRLEALNKNLVLSGENATDLRKKLEDLYPLTNKSSELVNQSLEINDDIGRLKTEIDQLREDQALEKAQRDEDASGMRDRIAALLTEADQLENDHSMEISEKDRQEANLKDIIQGFMSDKKHLLSILSGLQEDKTELTSVVDVLYGEIERIKLLIPESSNAEPDGETVERLGLFRRIKKIVEKKISDFGQDDSAAETVDKDSAVDTYDNIQNSEDDVSTSKEPKSDPEPKQNESLDSRGEPEIQKEGFSEAGQEQIEKLELKPESQHNVSLGSLLKTEIDQLREDQALEKAQRDEDASGMRDRIAALLTEAEQLENDHFMEISEKDRQEANLKDIIQGFMSDKKHLLSILSGLQEDKTELTSVVDVLYGEIERIKLLIPESSNAEPDGETVERLGLFRRIKKIVEKNISDFGQDDSAAETVDKDSAVDTYDNIQNSEDDVSTSKEPKSYPEPKQNESLDSRGEPEIQKEGFSEAGQEQIEKLELKPESQHNVSLGSLLKTEIDQLREDQALEKAQRDEDASGMRDRIAALLTEAEQLENDHSMEISEKDRQEANLKDIIQGFMSDKKHLLSILSGLQEDKTELTSVVDVLYGEIERIKLLIPESSNAEPDGETVERLGLFRRIKKIVEKKISDFGQDDSAAETVDKDSAVDTYDNIQNSEDDVSTSKEPKSDPEPKQNESLDSRGEPEVQKEGFSEAGQEQIEKLELKPESQHNVSLGSLLNFQEEDSRVYLPPDPLLF